MKDKLSFCFKGRHRTLWSVAQATVERCSWLFSDQILAVLEPSTSKGEKGEADMILPIRTLTLRPLTQGLPC